MSILRRRRRSALRDNLRKPRTAISLTPTGMALVREIAEHHQLSKTELIERLVRGQITLTSSTVPRDITLDIENHTSSTEEVNVTSETPVSENKGKNIALEKQLQDRETQLNHLQQQLSQGKNQLQEQAQNYQELQRELEARNQQATKLQKRIEELENKLSEQQNTQPEVISQQEEISPKFVSLEANQSLSWLTWTSMMLIIFVLTALILKYYYTHSLVWGEM